ncbi:unnamed protein product, partial [Ectocarpus sp. 4 AP-2014]
KDINTNNRWSCGRVAGGLRACCRVFRRRHGLFTFAGGLEAGDICLAAHGNFAPSSGPMSQPLDIIFSFPTPARKHAPSEPCVAKSLLQDPPPPCIRYPLVPASSNGPYPIPSPLIPTR